MRDGALCIQLGFPPAALMPTNAVSAWSCGGIIRAAQLEASLKRGLEAALLQLQNKPP